MTPACGYCDAAFGSVVRFEAHGAMAHLDSPDGEVVYFEGDWPPPAVLLDAHRHRERSA